MERNNDAGNRGQVGIGTLIVFIAMVLVAAIAAGVLINTAGFLQTQAEDTGTESTQQVADAINVITEVGEVSPNDQINEVRMGVQPAAGANDINLAGLTLQFLSDDSFEELTIGDDNSTGDQAGGDADPGDIVLSEDLEQGSFLVNPVTAEDEEDVVMTSGSDRYELVIPLDYTSGEYAEILEVEGEEVVSDAEENVTGDQIETENAPVVEITEVNGTAGGEALEIDDFEIDDDGNVTYVGDETIGNDDTVEFDYRYSTTDDVNKQSDLSALEEGETAQVTITTDVGSQTVAFLQVPDSLVGPDTGETVNL